MRILTLFLALSLTLLPESVSYANTTYYGQEVCAADVSDAEEEAILRSPQRMAENVQASSETESGGPWPVFSPLVHYRSVHYCFERLWLAACTLRL